MIPALAPAARPTALAVDFVAELRLRGFDGDITHAHADRTVFATDNSIYQLPPQAVLSPRHELDVVRIAKLSAEPRFRSLTFSPRGGGTWTCRAT
jgi:FAD/FMN-containing dehydrogenase